MLLIISLKERLVEVTGASESRYRMRINVE